MFIARQLQGRGASSERQERNKFSPSYRQHNTLNKWQTCNTQKKYKFDLEIRLKSINFNHYNFGSLAMAYLPTDLAKFYSDFLKLITDYFNTEFTAATQGKKK